MVGWEVDEDGRGTADEIEQLSKGSAGKLRVAGGSGSFTSFRMTHFFSSNLATNGDDFWQLLLS
jgi:hypothetical protein